MNRKDAQKRINRILAFREELSYLQSEQIVQLPPADTQKIQSYHQGILTRFSEEFDTDNSFGQANLSIGMQIASTLGAVAFAAALFLMIEAVWPYFSDWGRLIFGTSLPFAGIILTATVHRIFKTPYYTGLATLTAIAGFLGALLILGYQYNLTSSALSVIMLGLFGLTLSIQYRLLLPLFLSSITTLIGISGLLTESLSYNVWPSGDPNEVYLIPALITMAGIVLNPTWRAHQFAQTLFNGAGTVAGAILLFLIIAPMESHLPFEKILTSWFYAALSVGIGIGSLYISLKNDWAVTRHLTTAFLLAVLIIKYIDLAWKHLPDFLFYLIFGLFAVGCIVVLRRVRTKLIGADQ